MALPSHVHFLVWGWACRSRGAERRGGKVRKDGVMENRRECRAGSLAVEGGRTPLFMAFFTWIALAGCWRAGHALILALCFVAAW